MAGDGTTAPPREPLQLVAIKRCALGVLAIELPSDALLHAFVGAKRDVSSSGRAGFRGHLLGLSSEQRPRPTGSNAPSMPTYWPRSCRPAGDTNRLWDA